MKKLYGTFAAIMTLSNVPEAKAGRTLSDIANITTQYQCYSYEWKNRGRAPAGYIKGMAQVFAKDYCRLRKNESVANLLAKRNTGDSSRDVLAWYESTFDARGLEIDRSGVDTLRTLYTLGIGLGMRESSGKYCEGRDASAGNTSSDTAEAGMFQTSWNASSVSSEVRKLFDFYRANPSKCLLETFKQGVSCSASNLRNYGSGTGLQYQVLAKSCPAFAAEFAMITLRTLRKHYGPINTKAAEVSASCGRMLDSVQDYVDRGPAAACADLL